MKFFFTVCDNAAEETCPIWPGQSMTAHWGVREPAAGAGAPDQIARAFRVAFLTLDRRITLFLSLPLSSISRLALKKEIESTSAGDKSTATQESYCLRFLYWAI